MTTAAIYARVSGRHAKGGADDRSQIVECRQAAPPGGLTSLRSGCSPTRATAGPAWSARL